MQTTNSILLIRPANFGFNSETELSNVFQTKSKESENIIQEKALREFDHFSYELEQLGLNVNIIEDTNSPKKPDAIFPNNWITFHSDGTVILYPMHSPNRRIERRADIIDKIKKQYHVSNVLDLSHYESENRFLEGTGSMIFDHRNKIAYACLSPRTDKALFLDVCKTLNYKPISFQSLDENGNEIYHTNVMMCVGEKLCVICLESIKNKTERKHVYNSLTETGHDVIDISFHQMNNFAGNMLELKTDQGKSVLILSQKAFHSLTEDQLSRLKQHSELHPFSIPTIESIGGGSVRCMIAELFLPEINSQSFLLILIFVLS